MRPLPELTDRELVLLYRAWSEETFCSSFLSLTGVAGLPDAFVEWLSKPEDMAWYELDLIARWRKGEA